jgi:hypothetical protein
MALLLARYCDAPVGETPAWHRLSAISIRHPFFPPFWRVHQFIDNVMPSEHWTLLVVVWPSGRFFCYRLQSDLELGNPCFLLRC